MGTIGRYTIRELLTETAFSRTCRIVAEDAPREKLLLRLVKTTGAGAGEIARFRKEFTRLGEAGIEGVVGTREILETPEGIALVQEEFPGVPLRRVLAKGNIPLPRFLSIGVALTRILGKLHEREILHLDIKPAGILYDEEQDIVRLTDFGIIALLTRENEEIYDPRIIRETLPYMAPEQTGRMNRDVDYRADFYSLGAVFYEMLTGAPPFSSADPMELIHSTIARMPDPPFTRQPGVPAVVSDIVMKMLAKTAEERYQNAYGVMNDLEECARLLSSTGEIPRFPVARRDISPKFNIPQVLVGRERELGTLLGCFERIASHGESDAPLREILLVSGTPGIGKSALVNEIHKPIVASRGYFIAGKFEQFKKDLPYSAIISAFQGLMRQLLSESEERLERWRAAILAALGHSGRIICNVIPDLELVIGKQAETPDLNPEEIQNRFRHLFRNFIGVFAGPGHPLVLFLDDLQWADAASLRLLESLLRDEEIGHFLFIGAHRSTEVGPEHPFAVMVDQLRKNGVTVQDISLEPLAADDVALLLSHFLRTEDAAVAPLARLTVEKTGGNPFFVNQFMKNIYDEGLIRFDPDAGWSWKMEELEALQITDNVVELMVHKIRKLPAEAVDIVKACACIGNHFDLETIAAALGKAPEALLGGLGLAQSEGLIGFFKNTYRFHHDRIREAAYSLLGDQEKTRMHHRIGSIALARTPGEQLRDRIFFITHHLNLGAVLIERPGDRIGLAGLNLQAGKKAKDSTAYAAAIPCFQTGISLLGERPWEGHYGLSFPLHLGLAECLYLTGRYEEALRIFDELLANARSKFDTAQVYNIRSLLLMTLARYEEVMRYGAEALRMFGMRTPTRPGSGTILREVLLLRWRLRKTKPEDFLSFPQMTDPEILTLQRLIESTGQSAFYTWRNLNIYFTLRSIHLAIDHGVSDLTPFALALLACIIGSALGDFTLGERYGRMAMRMDDAVFGRYRGMPPFIFAWLVQHWTGHARNDIPLFRETYRVFLEAGNIIYACHSVNNLGDYAPVLGNNLDEVFEEYARYEQFVMRTRDPFITASYTDNVRGYDALQGRTDAPWSLDRGDRYEETREREIKKLGNSVDTFLHYSLRMRLGYLFGALDRADAAVRKIKGLRGELTGSIHIPEFNLYASLIMAARCPRVGLFTRLSYRARIAWYQRQMRTWALHSPENFLHKHLLVEAERARLSGKPDRAIGLYRRAIAAAAGAGYLNMEAIASERLGDCYLSFGDEQAALEHLLRATDCYRRWGATAKADALERTCRGLKAGTAPYSAAAPEPGAGAAGAFDLASALKGSQALAGEIKLGKLLEKIITILMENAGAEKGCLILESRGLLCIEAYADLPRGMVTVLQSEPVDESASLSPAIVHYARRTGETVIIADAAKDGRYANDPYIGRTRPRSILCTPVVHQGNVAALLYLENNVTADAFVPERVRLLSVLSSQAAVSIDNARLYANLEEKVAERTRELRQARDALWGEMQLAAKIQTVLLPEAPSIPGYDIFGSMIPADQVGGDYYDIINGEGAHWALIGDVSGHGVPAGLIMMMVQTSVQLVLRQNPSVSPALLLDLVNRAVSYNINRLREEKYMTLTALRIHEDGRVVHAGLHQDMLVYRAAGNRVERIDTYGTWLGIAYYLGKTNRDAEFRLESGDVLLLFTDGITEARDETGTLFGIDSLISLFAGSAGAPDATPASISRAILKAIEGCAVNDDVTLLVIKRR